MDSVLQASTLQALGAIGTHGWRAPEVMLELGGRICASDLWAVGLLFVTIATRCSSVLKWKDDWALIAEICGSVSVNAAARVMARENQYQNDLQLLKEPVEQRGVFRNAEGTIDILLLRDWLEKKARLEDQEPLWGIPDEGLYLMSSLLDPNPVTRLSAAAALQHNYFRHKRYRQAHRTEL